MKQLIFHNAFGLGDLFESREFVLDWMRTYGVETAEYYCRFPAVFEDLPQIKTFPYDGKRFGLRDHASKRGGVITVNTWIGALNAETKPKGDYVIWPGVGCTVDNLYRMHRDYQRRVGLRGMKKPIVEYLSDIDYSKVPLGNVVEFAKSLHSHKLILLCNGPTGSQHAENFSMTKMVELFPHDPGQVFIFTQHEPCAHPNAFFTDDITGRAEGASDFNAISYLSTYCSVIVGRCSGAQMVCETKRNWNDARKTLLSFTHHDNGATFVRDPVALGLKMRRVWSGASTPEAAAEVLKGVLE